MLNVKKLRAARGWALSRELYVCRPSIRKQKQRRNKESCCIQNQDWKVVDFSLSEFQWAGGGCGMALDVALALDTALALDWPWVWHWP